MAVSVASYDTILRVLYLRAVKKLPRKNTVFFKGRVRICNKIMDMVTIYAFIHQPTCLSLIDWIIITVILCLLKKEEVGSGNK